MFFFFGAGVFDTLDDAMSIISWLTIIILLFLSLLVSSSTRAQQLQIWGPSTMPLAVCSPYLNCQLQYNESFSYTWPTTFNHLEVCHPHIFYWPRNSDSQLSLLDPRVDCHRTCWQPELFVPGGCWSESHQCYCELNNYYHVQPYTHYSQCAGWTHGSQSHLSKSYRGPFSLFVNFVVLIHIILSLKIGSSNPSHSCICLSLQTLLII